MSSYSIITPEVLSQIVSEELSPAGNKQTWKNVIGHIKHPLVETWRAILYTAKCSGNSCWF